MRLCSLLFFLITATGFFAQQSPLNNELLFKFQERQKPSETFDVLVVADPKNLQKDEDLIFKYSTGGLCNIRCTAEKLSELIKQGIVSRAELPAPGLQPLNDTMLWRNRLAGVKAWTSPLPRAYDGEGVLMGIIDTGTDFKHPDFKDSLGKTRILYLWDQRVQTPTNSPMPYLYGQEWTSSDINNNLCTHDDFQYYGHGTGVSGIAAGNGKATGKFEGVAPKSDLLVVAVDFNKSGPTVADAVHYILAKATQLSRPVVINASLGNYYGSHDATDLEAISINNQIANIPGRVMVAAVGNAGHVPFHVRTQLQSGDTLFTWFRSTSNIFGHSLYADLSQVQQVKFRIGANRSNYSDLGAIPFYPYTYALNSVNSDTLKHNGNRIGIIETAASINSSGVYELSYQITADSLNLLWRIESTGSGLHDAWNFDLVNAPLPSSFQYPSIVRYAHPDSLMNMVSSFQCSDEVLTVGNYVNVRDFRAINNNTVNTGEIAGNLVPESSAGPTRDLRQKPDVSATGNNLTAAMCLDMQAFLLANAPQVVADGSMHIQSGGSSAASPVVAGLAALYLQKNPNATNKEIISAIRNCAYKDNYTSTDLPHPRWGFGKLDGKAALMCNDAIVLSNNEKEFENQVRVYPNPFQNSFKIQIHQVPFQLKLYDVKGQCIFSKMISEKESEINLPEVGRGLLLLQVSTSDQIQNIKIIRD